MDLLSGAGPVRWQQSKQRSQQLKKRHSVALFGASVKDELIKQHAKIAEEVVSDLEDPEVEATTLKHDLGLVMQQKLSTEDRVSHLDGALKEFKQQLQLVREERKEKIHGATTMTSREWEQVCAKLEGKLLCMEQKYLDRDAENKAISKLLQERTVAISEISDARSHAEADLNVLQIRLESMEKEHSALKLEFSVLKKELEKRNEENALNNRSTQAASKQHLEDCKKIAKLEGECQHLRGLVCKKLPGFGALVPIKLETESSKDNNVSNRKKMGDGTSYSREKREDMGSDKLKEESPGGVGKDVDALLDHLTAMEDETQLLKELLAKEDSELPQVRLVCARMASKLLSVEEQLENLSCDRGLQKIIEMSALDKHNEAGRSVTVSCEPSVSSVSEDGNEDCSDDWLSATVPELAHFKVQKGTYFQEPCLHMPKLQPDNTMEMDPSVLLENGEAVKSTEQTISCKDAELHAAQQLCDQLNHKFRVVETELATVQTQHVATQSSLQTMQGQFDAILHSQDNGKVVEIILDQVREALGTPNHMKKVEEKTPSICIAADIKALGFGPDLMSTVGMLVRTVEDLGCFVPVLPLRNAQQDGMDLSQDALECSSHGLFWQNNDFNEKIKAFSAGSNLFLQGQANIVHFLADLASILGDLVRTRVSKTNVPSQTTVKSSLGDTMSLAICKAYSPSSISTKLDMVDKDATRTATHDENSIAMALGMHELTKMEEELRKVQGQKVALETQVRMEFQRLNSLDNEIVQLRGDKVELEHKLQGAEQVKTNLGEELTSAESSRQLVEEQPLSFDGFQAEAESQLKAIEAEWNRLKGSIGVHDRGCLEKNSEIAGLQGRCQEFTEQLLKKPMLVYPKCSSVSNDWEKKSKEQEIAAKLAHWQQTIVLLRKQLSTLTSSNEQFNSTSQDPSWDWLMSPENDSLSKQYIFSHDPLEFQGCQGKSFLEADLGTFMHKKSRMHGNAKKETDWEPHRYSNASDTLDYELVSLSKSGRPLLELLSPAHEHYIQAVEQLTSSDEDCMIPRKVEPPVMMVKGTMKPPLHRKNMTPRKHTGVKMSKSIDDRSSKKHKKTFSRLFSRLKNF